MKLNNFIFICLFFIYLSKGLPLNHPRKLQETKINETILLGFDNYTTFPAGYNNYSISFYTYFLFKNWNWTEVPYNELNSFLINSEINCTNKKKISRTFNCSFSANDTIYPIKNIDEDDIDKFDIISFECQSNLIEEGIPKIINITTNFSKDIPIISNGKFKISSSFEVFKKDLLKLKDVNMFKEDHIQILRNSSLLSKSSSYLKIKGDEGQDLSKGWNSENIELLTKSYGIPKKIRCSGEYKTDSINDEYRYFLESKDPINLQNNTDLNYAVVNFTKLEQVLILDFKEGEQSVIKQEKREDIKSSKGLSTGGIVAIIIPSIIVLLGVVGLVYFLSRSVVPPPVKNAGNTTLGIGSSEAVVHQ